MYFRDALARSRNLRRDGRLRALGLRPRGLGGDAGDGHRAGAVVVKTRGAPRRISRGVRVKPERSPRKPPLLSQLLAALDARPDVTVLTRAWPVLFVQLRYALEKTVINPDGFSPLHRETPLFYGQAWQVMKAKGFVADEIGRQELKSDGAMRMEPIPFTANVFDPHHYVVTGTLDVGDGLFDYLGPIHPEVAVRLGLQKPVEREEPLTGRPLQR